MRRRSLSLVSAVSLVATTVLVTSAMGLTARSAQARQECALLTTGRTIVTFPAGIDAAARLRALGARHVQALGPATAVGDLGGRRLRGALRMEPELRRPFLDHGGDTLSSLQWAVEVQHGDAAIAKGDGTGVKVAVLDSGVDGSHPDLEGQVLAGADARTSPPTPLAAGANSDIVGHGTAVAGIIAAVRDNNEGISGLSPKATIIPVVVGTDDGVTSSAFVRGLDFAVASGARVANLSFGGCGTSAAEQAAVHRAVAAGVIVVASSGNKPPGSPDPIVYPAAYDGVIGVGATTRTDGRAEYSVAGDLVDLSAPGGAGSGDPDGDLVTTLPAFPERGCPAPCYGVVAGTSFASPYVAAVMALAWGAAPSQAAETITSIVTGTSIDLGPVGRDTAFGEGRVDANGAVALAAGFRTASRIQGPDRYATAAALSGRAFPDGSEVAFLARGDVFSPDALTGGPAAIERGGPILLTEQCALPPATSAELNRLGATEVVVLGGAAAVCDDVLRAAEQAIPGAAVRRIEGVDRFATAAAVATDAFSSGATTAYLARGEVFSPDALVGGPVAGKAKAPILLATQCGLPPVTRQALDQLATTDVVVLGGASAVCDAVVAELQAGGRSVTRLAGADRYETAVAVARSTWPDQSRGVVVARGDTFSPDALAAAPYAAVANQPLLITGQCATPPSPAIEVNRLDVAEVVLAGGPGAICDQQVNRLL